MRTHYFEDGNVQLNQEKSFGDVIQCEQSELVGEIMKFIQKSEMRVVSDLEEIYENIPGQFLKAMRRQLPVTQERFNWNQALLKTKKL